MKITPKAFGRDRRLPITNRYTAGGRAGPLIFSPAPPAPRAAPNLRPSDQVTVTLTCVSIVGGFTGVGAPAMS